MKYFFDTEFYDNGETIVPISLGIISETGEKDYVEWEFNIDDYEETSNVKWLKKNVIPHLKGNQLSDDEIRDKLLHYFERTREGGAAEFWLYYGAWDWLLFCRAISHTGMLMNGPPYMSMYFNEIMQLGPASVALVRAELNKDPNFNYCHNALEDAIFQKELYDRLTGDT